MKSLGFPTSRRRATWASATIAVAFAVAYGTYAAELVRLPDVRSGASTAGFMTEGLSNNQSPPGGPFGPAPGGSMAPETFGGSWTAEPWTPQWLPDGLMWTSYLAGVKEPRFALVASNGSEFGPVWDSTMGGRVALWRNGTTSAYRPEGWEFDLEGAAIPRIQPSEKSSPLVSCDYRVGVPIIYAEGPWQFKTGYTHLSSHLGDEFMLRNPGFRRINYVRDSLMLALAYFYTDDLRLYAEYDYAFVLGGGAQPSEFQFGADYSPAVTGGAPFAAFYSNLRQELDFGGYFVTQAGWQWRGGAALHTFRLGAEYVNGKSTQYEFFNRFEQRVGLGLWYDF